MLQNKQDSRREAPDQKQSMTLPPAFSCRCKQGNNSELLKVRRYISVFWILIPLAGWLISSCSTEKNTAATRAYHNLTSHYNIYFNGEESFKEGKEQARENVENDFTTLLPIFLYEDKSVHQSVTSQMKRAIDKATKVITFHSITAKPKIKKGEQTEEDKAFYEKNEYNKWVDDSYMLIGKSYMYQGEFFMASESFKHVITTFPELEVRYLAYTWLVRAYNVIGDLDESERILANLTDLEEFPEDYLEQYYTTLADFHMRKESYADAADYLEKALDTRPSREKRIRYTFILAQLHQQAGENEAAIDSYQRVVRMNPPYVMAFNAKVNMAEAYEEGIGSSREIRKLLHKMLNDSKNEEYRDQIYFALGNLAMEEGNREQAIEYYHLSVSTSVQNPHQKGESCLTLAQLYYEQPEYTLSAAYYDTAVNLLEPDYPGYNRFRIRSQSLNQLVGNVRTYELQDSLQTLAAMPEGQRLEVVDSIISRVRRDEAEAARKKREALEDMAYNRNAMRQQGTGGSYGGGQDQGGKWYFYNLNAKSFGQPEFRMKWGDRELEDNWRRSNKQTTTQLLEEDTASTGEEILEGEEKGEILDNKSREYYLRDIPMTDSAMQVSHDRLQEALFNMAMIYKDDLLDYRKAVESLEELIERYPRGTYKVSAAYHLHELYNILQEPGRASYYKELLSREFPDHHLTKLLTNPNYIRELEEEEQRAQRYYEKVYEKYRDRQYVQVINEARQGMKQFEEDQELIPKFRYLLAMSRGAVDGKEAMKTELDSLIAQHPGTQVADEAREIVAYMYETFPVIKEADQEKEAEKIYSFVPDAPHFFMIALEKSENLNIVNFNLLNYNLDNFNAYDLEVEMVELEANYNVLIVREFKDAEGALRYGGRVENDAGDLMGEIPTGSYEMVVITPGNYETMMEEGEVTPYLLFYRKHYTQEP